MSHFENNPNEETVHHGVAPHDPFYFFDKLPACVRQAIAQSDYTAKDDEIYLYWTQWKAAGRTDEQFAEAYRNLNEKKREAREREMFSGSGEGDIV